MATSFKFNPFTGTFDIVGTSGGGSGTVTSITFANGLSASPNPITVAGTASLDIHSLTHEPSLAAGDEFAFVDVSVGTGPTAQRKVTFAEIEAALTFTPTGPAGGDLSGTYPNPTVVKINTVALGTTTATTGHLLVADGSAWQSVAMSGDATLVASGALTLASVIVAGGPTGSSTQIPVITWDAKGRLLAVTTAAAATGSVTSISQGTGILLTPNPITTTGSVDLTINALTTETTVASGDLFAFQDVSVGTTPAAQRKVTASNLAAGITPLIDHNSLANLTVGDPHTQYFYLAGRAGGQTAKGGTALIDRLTLMATASVLGTGGVAQLYTGGPDAFFVVGPGGAVNSADATIIANASSDPGAYAGIHLQNDGVDNAVIQYRPNGPNIMDWIYAGELQFQGTPGGGIVQFQNNGDVMVLGDGLGGGHLFVGFSGTQFEVDDNGNIVKLNSVTTSCPTSNVLGYLHNNGSGVWAWQAIPGSDITGAALTKVDDTNVTLTLGGTPATALLRATSLTLGWTGQLAIGRGGTGASTALAAFNALSPLTTRGDLLTRDATNNVRLGIGGADTVLGSNGTDPAWVAAGAKGGGLPTCTNTQTLRATGTDTWAASSVLTNDGTNLVDSGTLTVQGASVTCGTAGTAFTATFGQGGTGTDASTVIVKSGNSGSTDAQLILRRNSSDLLKLSAVGGFAGVTPLAQFATALTFQEAGGTTTLLLATAAATFGVAGTAYTATVGQGTTGTDSSTLTIRSGNGAAAVPTLNLNRNTTNGLSMNYDGTNCNLAYLGNFAFAPSGANSLIIDSTGKMSQYRAQTTAGNGVGSILANVALTAQTANIGATNLVASTAAAGMYRATLHYCTTTAGNAVTITGQINYTSDVTNTAVNFVGATIAINTLDAKVTTTFTFQARTTTAITYQTNQSGALGTGRYALYIILERLS